MECTKSSVERVEKRGVIDGKCKVCGEQIMLSSSYRSIWYDGMAGGGGEVRTVAEAYCPKCDGKPELPSMGTPIYESQICEVATA
jgi:hypothetical protein